MISPFPELLASPWRLRQFKTTDSDLVREASTDAFIPLITTVPAVFTDEAAQNYISRQWERYEKESGYSFVIADEKTDRGVGSIGLWLYSIREGRASIGYWLVPSARGQNIATIALKKICSWAIEELNIPRLQLYAEPWNIASIKTAEAAGFEKEGLLRSWQQVGNERKDVIMMSLINPNVR